MNNSSLYSKELVDWCKDNKIKISFSDIGAIHIDGLGICYHLTYDRNENVFEGKRFSLNVKDHKYFAENGLVDYYIYEFGGIFYYTPIGTEDSPEFNVLKYVGSCIQDLDLPIAFLGIHGGYELLNGSRDYKDWCKKALFFGYKDLAICERNTLAGAIAFQQACEKTKVKSIIGETVIVCHKKDKAKQYEIKLYVQSKIGWQSLLKINRFINIENNGYIDELDLFNHTEGLVAVILNHEYQSKTLIKAYKKAFSKVFYQFDLTEWRSNDKDKAHLLGLKKYLDEYYDELDPILINDAYYLDKEESYVKRTLNGIGKVTHNAVSNDQYFKNLDDHFEQFSSLFKEDDERMFVVFQEAAENTKVLADLCDFKIELGKLRLPKYEMSETLSKSFNSNEDLFFDILQRNISNKVPENKLDEYLSRLEIEVDVISRGGFIDYFLILWDIVEWCKEQKILTGIGRGSAGGSLIAYLMGITKIDPLKYGLLFERFLNESRILSSLPDIDVDFEGNRRSEVKRYMEQKYGEHYVCSVGSYTTLQVRAAFSDLSRHYGKLSQEIRPLSVTLDEEGGDWKDVFLNAAKKPKLKNYVKENSHIINEMRLVLGQPKSASIHASAVIIVPKEDEEGNPMTIYDWLPMRKTDEGLLVCEWEGSYVEAAGFLKEDILGIRQLDKFRSILDYIEREYGTELSLEEIPLNDNETMSLFQRGLNEDVFHFGSQGLKGLSKELYPEDIEDLVAMIALHRPGSMESGSDRRYVKVKNGEEEAHYDYMLQEVTEQTYGQYIYQEQVMKATQILGGFSLVDADGIRRAMGKKIKSLMDSYKKQFLEYAVDINKCDLQEAQEIWDKLELFAGYGFNKSHAAAYAITGYISQYLKAKYPLAFWTTAFQYAKDEDIPRYLDELDQTGNDMIISFPDINGSDKDFKSDSRTNTLYWSLSRIKQVGEVAAEAIIDERNKNGNFYSLEEFYNRVPKNKCKRNVVENLILAGCFDEVERDVIKDNPINRRILIAQLYDLSGAKIPNVYLEEESQKKYWWTLKQVTLSGKGFINYEELVYSNIESLNNYPYVDTEDFFESYSKGEKATVAGIITKVIHQKMQKKDAYFAKILLLVNDKEIQVTVWNELWKDEDNWQNPIKSAEGSILIIDGIIDKKEPYNRVNILQTLPTSKFKIIEKK